MTRAVRENHRDDDFGVRGRVTGDVTRKRVYIGDELRFARSGRGAADALTNGDPDASGLALEGPEYQLGRRNVLRVGSDQIKTRPVQIGQRVIDQCGGVGEVGDQIAFTL